MENDKKTTREEGKLEEVCWLRNGQEHGQFKEKEFRIKKKKRDSKGRVKNRLFWKGIKKPDHGGLWFFKAVLGSEQNWAANTEFLNTPVLIHARPPPVSTACTKGGDLLQSVNLH